MAKKQQFSGLFGDLPHRKRLALWAFRANQHHRHFAGGFIKLRHKPQLIGAARQALSALMFSLGMGHCAVIVTKGTSTEMVQRFVNWNERSKGDTVVNMGLPSPMFVSRKGKTGLV
jgi:hypothetical protein